MVWIICGTFVGGFMAGIVFMAILAVAKDADGKKHALSVEESPTVSHLPISGEIRAKRAGG
jgi:hypothetical protein